MRARWALLLLALMGAGVAEPDGYRMDNYRAPVPDTVAGGIVVHTAALQAMLAQGGVVLIDVLPAPRRPPGMKPGTPWMPEPRRDIPGSVWLPDVGRGAINPAMQAWFRERLASLTGHDRSKPVVFYCLQDCWMSWNATRRAARIGYARAYWYPDGTDGWEKSGLPLAINQPEQPPE